MGLACAGCGENDDGRNVPATDGDTIQSILGAAFTPQGERELCVAREYSFEGATAFYELIDVIHRGVWGTPNFTADEYAAFTFPLTWTFWRKNDPRTGLSDGGRFLRSPGCTEAGQYSYLRAFGKEFLQVVRLISLSQPVDSRGLIRKTELEKYHLLTYNSGRTVTVLNSPEGERFIGVSRTVNPATETPTLPDGWTLTEHVLTSELQVDLSGTVKVLRMDNEDSYQGPLSADISL